MTDSEPASDQPEGVVGRDRVSVRRAPRYGRFLVIGLGLGAVAAFVGTNLFPIDRQVGFGPLFGYLLLFGLPIGAALGGLVAVSLDAIASRRATELEAERTTVDPAEEEVEGEMED